jgi:hypothetical protein
MLQGLIARFGDFENFRFFSNFKPKNHPKCSLGQGEKVFDLISIFRGSLGGSGQLMSFGAI